MVVYSDVGLEKPKNDMHITLSKKWLPLTFWSIAKEPLS